MSRRAACKLVKVSRRRLKYASRINARNVSVVARLKALAEKYPSYGVRMLWAKLRQLGIIVNRKRVRRLCLKHGLLLKRKRKRKRRGIGVGVPCKAAFPNHVWAYDFVEDRAGTTGNAGRKLRILTIEDEFTRQCIEIEVEHRMNAKYVGQALLKCFATHGVPEFIRSDNGSEFIAKSLMQLMKEQNVKPYHVEPGSPWQNGFDERFNGTYRTDCANQHTFHSVDLRVVILQHLPCGRIIQIIGRNGVCGTDRPIRGRHDLNPTAERINICVGPGGHYLRPSALGRDNNILINRHPAVSRNP